METTNEPTPPKSERAYLIRYRDGDMEPCMIVFARDARGARRQYRAIDGAEYELTEAERRPEFDGGFPTGDELMSKHGWWFTCHHCGDPVRHQEGEPAPVVLDECGCTSTVAHAKCCTVAVP